jgi:AcrR family transcriptional regulator
MPRGQATDRGGRRETESDMPGDTRGQLIDCALRLFYRDGFRNVGLDRILAEVELSKPAFYKHFESKDHLMLAALEAQHGRLESTPRDMLRREAGRAARDQLRAPAGAPAGAGAPVPAPTRRRPAGPRDGE